jgi:hypothetical protein
MWRRDI